MPRYTLEEAERRAAEKLPNGCPYRSGLQCDPKEREGGRLCLRCGWCKPVEMIRKAAIHAKLRGGTE